MNSRERNNSITWTNKIVSLLVKSWEIITLADVNHIHQYSWLYVQCFSSWNYQKFGHICIDRGKTAHSLFFKSEFARMRLKKWDICYPLWIVKRSSALKRPRDPQETIKYVLHVEMTEIMRMLRELACKI